MKYSLPRGLLFSRSNFPISRNRPPGARQRTEAWSFCSAREFRTRSTPLPFVSDIMSCSKEVSRELPMLWSANWNRSAVPSDCHQPHFERIFRNCYRANLWGGNSIILLWSLLLQLQSVWCAQNIVKSFFTFLLECSVVRFVLLQRTNAGTKILEVVNV